MVGLMMLIWSSEQAMQLTAQCAQINLSLDVAVVSLKEGIQHLEVTRL